ncbi:MAG: hypothetical protein ACOCUQ_02060 [Bacteroidota bacterium]
MSDLKHLTPEQIAFTAEAINENRFENVDENIRRHLTDCDQCASDVLMVADIAFDFKQGQKKQKSSNFPLENYSLFYPLLTAAAVFLLGVFVFAFLLEPDTENNLTENENTDAFDNNELKELIPQDQQVTDLSTDMQKDDHDHPTGYENEDNKEQELVVPEDEENKEKISQDSQVLLARFTPHEDLEKLVSNADSFYRGTSINIEIPTSIQWSDFDSLSWSNPENKNLVVEFFNNDNERILMENTTAEGIAVPDLDPGLYYWKLIDKENFDLLFTGKITRQK